ncbi:hypothetical protein K469DRAFT_715533 [Zopfia rhizophila CBS 207.26]|uniref:FAD-binding domain-containing protein n=1 Tax=Zopfia rhizophila CBS 207.26 TaxID=1314779 RepID=A0A6A6DME5_9PEZI|nr:hypothetical protein K469DRAFT_715533 [Zopfia rhizophila CBS 207.26]
MVSESWFWKKKTTLSRVLGLTCERTNASKTLNKTTNQPGFRYMPIVLNEFEKVGIFEPFSKIGFQSTMKGNKVLVRMNCSLIPKGSALKYRFAGMHLGQHQLAALFLEHAQKLPNFGIKWNHRFTSLQQDSDKATVHVDNTEGEKAFRAKYVIACDGASSAVRQSLSIPFDGTTWTNF